MPKVTIDGKEIEVEAGITIMQACEEAGAEIPRFCYHERLSIAGNCRMCLVDVEKSPKPVASCAMPVNDGMVVHTNTPEVKKHREGVLEFLLINHPLDCPICDQGGECDLQDQTMGYGMDHNRYEENKRAVDNKNMGPLISTIMTRCIHCTRCIRFTSEVAGVEEMGASGRGEDMEITTYLDAAVTSELSANVIDLCPVGALTSKPYAFTARPWELNKTESIDVMDAVGSAIRVDARGREVMRVLPRLNEDINEEWISDKTRYACDGLKYQRLDKPYVKRDGKLQPASWDQAFDAIKDKLASVESGEVAALAGDLACAESMKALKDLMAGVGSPNLDCRVDGAKLSAASRSHYIFNAGINGIEDADAILIIGSNPRVEAPIINARIRKRWLARGVKIGVIGPQEDLKYSYDYLGAGPDTLTEVANGSHSFAQVLKDAENPMIIIGQGALAREDGAAVLGLAGKIADGNGASFNMLHTAASRVAGLDLGLVPGEGGKDRDAILAAAKDGSVKVVFNLGSDEIDGAEFGDAFVIYLGTHGDRGAHRADVILPGAAYTEKSGTYVNTEGRVQVGQRAIFPPGDAREDWTILRALSAVIGDALPYDNLNDLRAAMIADAPVLAETDDLTETAWTSIPDGGAASSEPFQSPIADFYLTNPVARASKTMAECSAEIVKRASDGAVNAGGGH